MGLSGLRPGSAKDKESSKSSRKFDKKLQFYAKVKDTVTSLSAKKAISKKKKLRSRQKKLKVYDLSSLTEFLPELKAPRQQPTATNLKLNSKSRQMLIEKEDKQLRKILDQSAFKLDPLAVIHQHLETTQPAPVEKPEKKSSKTGKKKKKGKKSHSSGVQSMDI